MNTKDSTASYVKRFEAEKKMLEAMTLYLRHSNNISAVEKVVSYDISETWSGYCDTCEFSTDVVTYHLTSGKTFTQEISFGALITALDIYSK